MAVAVAVAVVVLVVAVAIAHMSKEGDVSSILLYYVLMM